MYAINQKRLEALKIEDMDIDIMEGKDINVDEYLEQLLQLYNTEDGKYSFEIQSLTDYTISICPKCNFPVVSIGNIVTCIKGCIKFNDVDKSIFSKHYTMDNFVDEYIQTGKEHKECNSNVNLMTFEDRIWFYCEKCLDETLNK